MTTQDQHLLHRAASAAMWSWAFRLSVPLPCAQSMARGREHGRPAARLPSRGCVLQANITTAE